MRASSQDALADRAVPSGCRDQVLQFELFVDDVRVGFCCRAEADRRDAGHARAEGSIGAETVGVQAGLDADAMQRGQRTGNERVVVVGQPRGKELLGCECVAGVA